MRYTEQQFHTARVVLATISAKGLGYVSDDDLAVAYRVTSDYGVDPRAWPDQVQDPPTAPWPLRQDRATAPDSAQATRDDADDPPILLADHPARMPSSWHPDDDLDLDPDQLDVVRR